MGNVGTYYLQSAQAVTLMGRHSIAISRPSSIQISIAIGGRAVRACVTTVSSVVLPRLGLSSARTLLMTTPDPPCSRWAFESG